MRPAAYKRNLAQREDNAKWLRCKVEPFIQGAPRPAALAVSEDILDPSGVDMTSWAFFANKVAPRTTRGLARASTTRNPSRSPI